MNEIPNAPAARGWSFRRRRVALIAGATAVSLGLSAGGFGLGVVAAQPAIAGQTGTSASTAYLPQRPSSRFPSGLGSGSGSSTATQAAPTAATSNQLTGVVTIVSDLYYGAGEAAGTGIIVTSDGTVLTNNHVIDGATSIEVTVESTGETYTADVVGYDATDDIAVLHLEDASGLDPVTLDDTDPVSVGDSVTSIGNAEGTGDLVAATGTVTATDQSITVGSESGTATESLQDLLELDAYVVSGDSGGPLLDSHGEVVGIVTAASSGSPVVTGYAIPIADAIAVWDQVRSGTETQTVQIGLPAFLGITLQSSAATSGAVVGGVLDNGAAAAAGLVAGDVITAIDGTPVATGEDLRTAVAAHEAGDSVTLTVTTAAGTTEDVTVTLLAGPAA